jgi:hypothetical protein
MPVVKPNKGSLLKNILSNLSPETETLLIPYLNRYLEEVHNTGTYEVHDEFKPWDHYYHPSGDCLKCKRQLFFEKSPRFKVEWKPSVELRRTFKVGHAVHAMLQAWVQDMSTRPGYPKSKYGPEVKVTNEGLNVRGSVDDILEFPNGDIVPTEYKTISGREFELLKEPKPAHKLQLGMYLLLKDLPYGILLYISKEYPHAMKEFRLEKADWSHVLNRWSRVTECLAADDIGPLEWECKEGSRQFENCPAHDLCRRVEH